RYTKLLVLLVTLQLSFTESRRFGARHKRQHGSNLYQPESFIIPGGEGSPQDRWSDWGAPSECSRTCGGGVAYQERECLDLDHTGAPVCTGGKRKYFSCNTQDCPERELDFRKQQCTEFNDVPFEGHRYQWVPYTRAPNPCELNCMPVGERFYYRHRAKVTDGTRCNDESFDVCVDGTCQPVGCDMMLGSQAKEDKCRICRGDGSSCKTASGLLDANNLQVGYNDLLLIPSGATNVVISERAPSNNYLAIRNLTGFYHLNGNYRIDFPRTMHFAGSDWHYERRPQGFAAPDRLTCLGPTTESVYLVLLSQDRNVGVNYEYSVSSQSAPVDEPDSYSWMYTAFEPCTVTCGGGVQTRNVTCNSKGSLRQVDEGLCNLGEKPPTTQKCGQQACPPRWFEGPWSNCSKPCGNEGKQTREVYCERVSADGETKKIEDDVCLDQVGNKPATERECNQGIICPEWYVGRWSPCNKLCGEGERSRKVVCYRKENGRITVLDDEECITEKPAVSEKCMLRPCEGVDYVTSSWSGCDDCGATVETRTVHCASKSGTVYDASFCADRQMPELRRECKLTPCEYQWYTSQWSKCSAVCGKGVQTRTVVCGVFDGQSLKRADDDYKCDPEQKPEKERECEGPPECPGQWFAGPWTDCDKSCGGGMMSRKVLCLANGTVVPETNCDVDKIQLATESCNKHDCTEDEVIPVEPRSKQPEVDDDYDEDELCDEDEEDGGSGSGDDDDDEEGSSVTTEGQDGVMMVTEDTSLAEGIELGVSGTTESSLETDEMMLSDATGFDTGATDPDEGSTTEATVEGSGDGSSLVTDVSEGSGDEGEATTVQAASAASEDASSDAVSSSTEASASTGSSVELDGSSSSTEASAQSSTESSDAVSPSESSSVEDSQPTTTDSASTTDASDPTTEVTETSISSTDEESSTTDASVSSTTMDLTSTMDDASTTDVPSTTDGSEAMSTTIASDMATGSSDAASSESSTDESSTDSSTKLVDTSKSTEASLESSTSESAVTGTSVDGTSESGPTEASVTGASTDDSSTTVELTEPTVTGSTEDFTGSTVTEESVDETTFDIWASSTGSTDEETDDSESSTPYSLTSIIAKEQKPRKCKPRPKVPQCAKSTHGCCPDGKTKATGPFLEGCTLAETCKDTKHGCCPDGVSPAKGPNDKGCPKAECADTLFGCCPDKVTPAEGNDAEGCPVETTTTAASCTAGKFGCCPDGATEAKGPNGKGCPGAKEEDEKEEESEKPSGTEQPSVEGPAGAEGCSSTEHGCCPDNTTAASGPDGQGCEPCQREPFGCCPDGKTPAHGYNGEGCCLVTPYGCCPDNIVPAHGPNLEGCDCQYAPYGCCPDNKTSARGHDNEGCGCQYAKHGCCPDKETEATGPEFEGCPCHAYQFGCCPDGVTAAKGPHNQGCHCSHSEFKCCSDGKTPAKGPDGEGCTCADSMHGCCPDGVSEAQGSKFEGCTDVPESPQKACALPKDKGPCHNYTVKHFFDVEYGGCGRFWYGGCEGNNNRFDSAEECKTVCETPTGKDVCQLPKISGPCTGHYNMWYYDAERNMCSQFTYGGCLGNANRFEKLEDCKAMCSVDDSKPPCEQPMDAGPCNGTFERWYYDKDSDACHPFYYGGCKGNKNNYPTEASCGYHCKKPGVHKPSCSEPLEQGSCNAQQARWYFASDSQKCMPFYFTGCDGNGNQFVSRDECEDRCPPKVEKDICFLPAEIGECQNYTAHWYFDTKDERCRQFYYGGCGGNGNNFADEQACISRCIEEVPKPPAEVPAPAVPAPERVPFDRSQCQLPMDNGDRECSPYVARYYYDAQTGSCSRFTYTGCGGNGNNFQTEEECLQACGAVPQDVCQLPDAYGDCTGNEERWFFEPNEQRCVRFAYSGCGGNGNNFASQAECERTCPVNRPVVDVDLRGPAEQQPTSNVSRCEDVPDFGDGEGDGELILFYYNAERQSCERFRYSGAGGNKNRFNSEEECERVCGMYRGVDVCRDPVETGPCTGSTQMYYYDPRALACYSFNYSGCEGNGNRFTTPEECEETCLPRRTNIEDAEKVRVCSLPLQQGSRCKAKSRKRWYYDPERETCFAFRYLGCGGNRNSFPSYKNCRTYCNIECKSSTLLQKMGKWLLLLMVLPLLLLVCLTLGVGCRGMHLVVRGLANLTNRALCSSFPTVNAVNPCEQYEHECSQLQCQYGIAKSYDPSNGCERCQCNDPCAGYYCPQGSQCVVDVQAGGAVRGTGSEFVGVCRESQKPGDCPELANATYCSTDCYSDADCRGNNKCCQAGCAQICISPVDRPVAPTGVQPGARGPVVLQEVPQEELDVKSEEGGIATLRCYATGFPPPSITWRKGQIMLNTNQGRYVLTSNGDLQIVQLHRTDSGTYVCVAENGVGEPVLREVQLTVNDPVPRDAYIAGSLNDTQVVELEGPATLRCPAGGHPKPIVTWWRETFMMPLKIVNRDYSLYLARVRLEDLGPYVCQAYSGAGKGISRTVTLLGYNPVAPINPLDEKYMKYVVPAPAVRPSLVPVDRYPSRPRPPVAQVPPVVLRPPAPVRVQMYFPQGRDLRPNSNFTVNCTVDGYPRPTVNWFKDGEMLVPTDRIHITDTHLLIVTGAIPSDSGRYKCLARNEMSEAFQENSVHVEGVYVPPGCTDNQLLAKCDLIVAGRYCNHKYYARFCCRSCTLAGQINVNNRYR
uniref:Papilin n=1 Tax=Anopheles epiroticus TaxID=199890 RepID=A0A182PGJ0_9DIPT